MPLDDGYALYRGTLTSFFPDTPENQGNYFHINLRVDVQGVQYQGAVDVDSSANGGTTGVQWRVVGVKATEISALLDLGPGFHSLASSATSGALDYYRSEFFKARAGCAAFIYALLGKDWDPSKGWKQGSNLQAYADFKPLLTANQGKANGIIVLGEPYGDGGNGLHNIHQNQGDPLDSRWADANGIWQDGATLMQVDDENWVFFCNKFSTQAYSTDDAGNPIP